MIQFAPAASKTESSTVVRTARTRAPAALPDLTPNGASSMTMQDGEGSFRTAAPFALRLGVGLAVLDIRSCDEMNYVLPKASGAETDFGKGARGGSNHSKLSRRNRSEQILGAWERDNISDLIDFASFHPAIFFQVHGGISMGKEFTDGCKAGAAMGEVDDVIGIQVVFEGPARPDASDGRSGVDEDTVHV